MSEELKPCPFCGGPAEYEEDWDANYSNQVACMDCPAAVQVKRGDFSRWNRRTPAEQPAPASTGREPIYQVQFVSEYASSIWHDATEDAYNTFMPERRRIVYAAPVAARELDVEAEPRDAAKWNYALMGLPNEEIIEMWRACGHSGTVPFSFAYRIQERLDEVAARSAAQGTQPESAPVSTDQAGDALEAKS